MMKRIKAIRDDILKEIPKDWLANKFKYVFLTKKGLSVSKSDIEPEGVPMISYGQVHSKTGTFFDATDLPRIPQKLADRKALLKKGDIVFADTSEDIEGSGNFSVMDNDDEIYAGYHSIVATPKVEVNHHFIGYLLESERFRSQIQSKVQGVIVYSITQKMLGDTYVWFPTMDEQEAIAQFLDKRVSSLDEARKILERQIELIDQQKKTIINDYVTGKRQVE